MCRAAYPKGTATAAAVLAMFLAPAFASGGSCPADVDGDGDVGVSDLLAVLADWGQGSGTSDFTGSDGVADGVVDVYDFVGVLEGWGPCP